MSETTGSESQLTHDVALRERFSIVGRRVTVEDSLDRKRKITTTHQDLNLNLHRGTGTIAIPVDVRLTKSHPPEKIDDEGDQPITPLVRETSYMFSEEDLNIESRAQKLQSSRSNVEAAVRANPQEFGAIINGQDLKRRGIIVYSNDESQGVYTLAGGNEDLKHLALIVRTPLGDYISYPNEAWIRFAGHFIYNRFAPLDALSAGKDKWAQNGIPNIGNPMQFPNGMENNSTVSAHFVLSAVGPKMSL